MHSKPSRIVIIKASVIFFIILFCVLYFYVNNPRTGTLRINEVSYASDSGYDWVEIYNPTMQILSLKGLYLTDDKLDLEKYEIDEEIVIEPNGFLVIYSENYDGELENAIKLNFDIKNGETVYLLEKQSLTVIDSLTIVSDENSSLAGSVGRFPNGSENTFVFTRSSIGGPNLKDYIPKTRPL